MEVINCVQGTDDWFRARLTIPTASNFSKIVTSKGEISKSIKDYSIELASEYLIEELEETYKSQDMQNGNDREHEARSLYQKYSFNEVKETGFMINGKAGYSADGLIYEDGILEIKCPKAITHTKYIHDNKIPTKYIQQCQGGLMVSGRKYVDFVSYNPNFKEDKKLFIKRVKRDEEFIAKLKVGIERVIELRDNYLKGIK
jgi:predicted phage-related endonuclease